VANPLYELCAMAAPQLPTPKGMSRSASASSSRAVEFRGRMISTLESCYPGIRDQEAFIQERVQKGVQKIREDEQRYWAWQKKMKTEVQGKFKLPEDQYAGKTPAEVEIREKAEKGQRALQERNEQYQVWLSDMKRKQEERMEGKKQERKTELATFAAAVQDREKQRKRALREEKSKTSEKAGKYWEWLAQTKEAVQRKPCIAPLGKVMSAKTVEEMTQRKRNETMKDFEQRDQEYNEWLQTVQKPKFTLPVQECNSVEKRDRLIMEAAQKKMQKLSRTSVEYNKWLKEMEAQKREKMMDKVKEKLEADRAFEQGRQDRLEALERKMAEQKKEQEQKEEETKKFLKDLQENVKAKPLLLEQVYMYGRVVC